jgi:hypothetical protein
MLLPPEIQKAKTKASNFMDIDLTAWPTVVFTAKPYYFNRSEFEAYLDVFAHLLGQAEPNSLRLLYDLSNITLLINPMCLMWQSAFSDDMNEVYKQKIQRTAIVLTLSGLRYFINRYFERSPATRPKKMFENKAEAISALETGWT